MVAPVTVVTPSVPHRWHLLTEAMKSVAAQTSPVDVHLVGVDLEYGGPTPIRNALLRGVDTEWVLFLDDDDLLDANFVQVLLAQSDGADVVIPHCRFSGHSIPPKYHNRPFDRDALRQHGIFPITVLARTHEIRAGGGFGDERYEDWELWNRMADAGARFKVVPEVLWTYRLGYGDHRTHKMDAA